MVKPKKNKKAKSDFVYGKKSKTAKIENPFVSAKPATSKKINPFEVHVNKEKFQILGRTCKHDKGLPGVSRAKAIKKRKETLGQEYLVKHKSNRFNDKRIGRQFDGDEIPEDVLNARLIAEKMSQMRQKQSKVSKFNLEDSEVLTHRGQTLEEIEQFRDDRSDDEDLENDKLDADFTEAAHFGGDAGQVKDRKEAIEEMIAEQKRRKLEIAKEKDEIHELTEKLDTKYKDVLSVLGKMTNSDGPEKKVADDYDKAMREMIFEPRGEVTDKLVSPEEEAKKEKERLEKLEAERLRRMQGDEEAGNPSAQFNHRSADDLDDGYFVVNEGDEEEGTLAYHLDGKLGTKIANGHEVNGEKTGSEEDSDDGRSEGDVEDDSDGEEEASGDESSNGSEEDENDDNLSDLKVSESESDIEEEAEKNHKKVPAINKSEKPKSVERLDLPFTIELPETYDRFRSLLADYNPSDQATIVERLIKCNHPKLDGVNREKVVKLFAFLMQYVNELFADANSEDIVKQFQILSGLNPHLYDLITLNPEKMSATFLKVIGEKYAEFRKNPKFYPPLETVVFFKLASNYFSTSDFRHAVVTPCYVFIQHILSSARVRTRQDVALGLFLVTVALEYGQLSKRFLPAALNFLLGVLYLSIPKRPVEVHKIISPFQSSGPMSKLLAIAEDNEYKNIDEEPLKSEDLVTTTFSTEFKIRAVNAALKLVKHAITILHENVGSNYLAEPFLEIFERLPLDVYPEFVRKNFEEAKETLQRTAAKKLTKIVPPEKKPKALRLLEPRVETVYDDKRRPKVSKDKEEKLKLVHKLRRETKGAIREIRRDTEFLQKIRIQQQLQSDVERKAKVKRIFQEASVQQGELNELSRAKKRKKF